MRERLRAVVVISAILAAVMAAGCAPAAGPVRVLMVVGGDYHDYDTLPARLADQIERRGDVAITVTDDLLDLAPDMPRYDVLMFNVCLQDDLSSVQRRVVLDHLASGRGLVAMHCSLWSFQSWPEWADVLGGFVAEHDTLGAYELTTLDPHHAVVQRRGAAASHRPLTLKHRTFPLIDEPYLVDQRDPNATVLIRTSRTHEDPRGKPRPGPEPQVWVKRVGDGRVFVATFGHDERSQADWRFVTLMYNGIRWSAGRLEDTRHNVLSSEERRAGFRSLFNGHDLEGWRGHPEYWTVEDGQIVGRARDLPHNVFLVHERTFGDFELRFDVQLVSGNSGVQFRSEQFPDYVVKGYQADVADQWYGSLYDEGGGRHILANGWKDKGEHVVVLDGWNQMTVLADGPNVTITLNDLTTVEFTETDARQPRTGVIALQLHTGPPQEVRFRDIRVRPLRRG